MTLSVLLLGRSGFVGSALSKQLNLNTELQVTEIGRENFYDRELRNTLFDILVHSANPSRRFQANSNPDNDYIETVNKTKEIISAFNFKNLILISSLSCRTQLNTHYGRHRLKCEELSLEAGGSVIRLGPMFGGNRTSDTLHDIIHSRPVYYSRETRYSYASVEWISHFISSNLLRLTKSEVKEVGARDFISLDEVASLTSSHSEFNGPKDDQITIEFTEGPSVSELIRFVENLLAP